MTIRVALDPFRDTVPSVVFPIVKITEPVGAALPLAGCTVAVKTVLPDDDAMLGGFAVTDVVVFTAGGVTVTATVLLELAKLPVP